MQRRGNEKARGAPTIVQQVKLVAKAQAVKVGQNETDEGVNAG
jgi:hypothetical protein